MAYLIPGRGVSEKVSEVGFCLGSGLFGSCNSDYSRVQNKHSRTLINFLTFFQGLRPYSIR